MGEVFSASCFRLGDGIANPQQRVLIVFAIGCWECKSRGNWVADCKSATTEYRFCIVLQPYQHLLARLECRAYATVFDKSVVYEQQLSIENVAHVQHFYYFCSVILFQTGYYGYAF